MKKFFSCICALMLCAGLVSCKKQELKATDPPMKHKIGILAPAVTHGWVAAVAYFAEQRCKQLKDIDYKILTSQSAEQMTQQLDDLEAWGAEAIVTFPQWQGMEAPFAAAIKRGIKVVSFDIEVKADGIYLVSGDNESMGVASAKYIVEKVGKDATVAVLTVPTSGSVSELRLKGFIDTQKQIAPNLKLIERATKFTREDGLKDFADILTANKHIDAVFSMDDETSIGVLQAIKEAGRKDIKVVTGGGGCQEYFKMMPQNEEIWIQSALYAPSMIIDAVNAAYDLVNGVEAAPKKIIPTRIVDRTNYEKELDANSPY
jgi:ribose transport system substrate-binding protein